MNNADGTFIDYQRALGGLGNEFYLYYAVSTDFDAIPIATASQLIANAMSTTIKPAHKPA